MKSVVQTFLQFASSALADGTTIFPSLRTEGLAFAKE